MIISVQIKLHDNSVINQIAECNTNKHHTVSHSQKNKKIAPNKPVLN